MKTIISGLSLLLLAGAVSAQVQTTTPAATGSGQVRPAYPATTTTPVNGTINNGTTTPATTTTPYPGTGTGYPGTGYPGTGTTGQPGSSTPGTGTAPQPAGTPAGTPRTYSDKNNLINNSPNATPASPNPAVGNPAMNGR